VRNERDAQEDSAARLTRRTPWTVTHVEVLPGHRLSVRFADGTQGEVDLSHLVFSEKAGVFERLRDPRVFASVGIEYGAVSWPGDLDLAPDAMYDGIQATGLWVPDSHNVGP
jgi:hypothetical protein